MVNKASTMIERKSERLRREGEEIRSSLLILDFRLYRGYRKRNRCTNR